MTEKQYLDLLDEYEKKLNKENAAEILNKLEELYSIKPVRLKWFGLKAKALQLINMEENRNKALDVTRNKGWALFDYNGLDTYYDRYLYNAEYYKDSIDINRLKVEKYGYDCNNEDFKKAKEKINVEIDEFFDSDASKESIINLINLFFVKGDFVLSIIFDYVYQKIFNEKSIVRTWILNCFNVGYLLESLENDKNDAYIISMSDYNELECEAVANALAMLDKKVFIIKNPVAIETENHIDIKNTLEISLENVEDFGGFIAYQPVELVCQGKVYGDNRDCLINYITENYAEEKLSMILSSGELFNELCERDSLKKNTSRLYEFRCNFCEKNIAFGWSGSYLSYISRIYDFDVEEAINKKAECDFSIVIPARNSAFTLRHTLKTCLDIDYNGKYEIVISDNSTNGNQAVYELVKELNDDRIKYYKTPRNLHLAKSFEFAFLKAKGEFILSIGSDDGILPWSLKTIKRILEKYPNEEVLQWERGFYAWPKFNGGQQNQFIIPKNYKKNDYKINKVSSEVYLAKVLNSPQNMYSLPMLYINSGFRRSYMKMLLSKTGRLWDGICQDIYIGIINIAINKEILNIEYPLTIAGMANGSVGQTSNSAIKSVEAGNKEIAEVTKTANIGGFTMSATEWLMPQLGSDVSSLYNSLLRAVARGVMPKLYLEDLFDFKNMYLNCITLMSKEDVYYDKNVQYMKFVAQKHGKEFLDWFNEKVYPVLMRPKEVNTVQKKENNERTYKIGFNDEGGQILDASEYGVDNIYSAVKLFGEKSGLK